MVFNSVEFLVFLIIVFFLYWFAGKGGHRLQSANLLVEKSEYDSTVKGRHRLQSTILLLSSCIFYMFLIPEYILILFTTIIIDYVAGIYIERTEGRRRKIYLVVSIISTCLVLFIFKYYDFFIHNFNGLASAIGWNYSIDTLKIILPIGLSFHTFQSLSYVIEVYRRQQKAEKDFLIYSLYVMYFPQLVAGPIERAANLLPQFHKKPAFDEPLASEGMHQILWGLFKKVVIADACAVYANEAFAHIDSFGGGTLFLGSVYFALQIYCDFSGYSDIALGTSKLFGIKLMTNFRFPYFSRDIAEFWRRWHISLSTWFRDYVYFPLGGSRVAGWKKFRNVLIIFLVSGFWHGANWTFVAWGGLHALFYLPVLYLGKNRSNINEVAEGRWLPSLKETGQMLFTFVLVCFAWVFFRAPDIQTALSYCGNVFLNVGSSQGLFKFLPGLLLIIPFLVIEWVNRANHNGYMFSHLRIHRNWILLFETIMILMIIESYVTLDHEQFIYFQF